MVLFGLHILDVIVIVLYIGIVLWLGKKAGETIEVEVPAGRIKLKIVKIDK